MPAARQRGVAPADPAPAPPDDSSLTADEVCASTGLTRRELAEVERYGLLSSRVVAGVSYYDSDAVQCAHVVAVFLRHGVEPRHLRMYRNAVDREAALFEQVVLPLVKQRNPQARAMAVETLQDLTRQGAELRATLLHQSLRPYLEGS
jgi:DNA-binding transcriptional MerR regulator